MKLINKLKAMLNITFTGKIYDENNQLVNECKYRGLFIKQNSSSSNSKFSDERISFQGEYNINLGDGQWLTQDGSAGSGDRVVLIFWIPIQETHTSFNIVKYGFFEIVLTSDTTYIINSQIRPNICPNINISNSIQGLINEQIYVTDNSNDNHSWNFSINGTSIIMRQYHYWRRFEIFSIADIYKTTVNWNDGSPIEEITKTTKYHIFTTCGDKNLDFETIDNENCSKSTSKMIKIYLHQPAPGLNWSPQNPIINELVTFTPNIINWDNNISYVNYYIDGVLKYNRVSENFIFSERFSTKKTYIIRQEIFYNNCFEQKSIYKDYILHMENIYPTCDFKFTRNNIDTYLFESLASDRDGYIIDYDWKVYDVSISGSPQLLAEYISTPNQTFIYHFPYDGKFKIYHKVTDNDNAECFKEIILDYTKSPCKTGCEGCPTEELITIKSIYQGFEVELYEDEYEIVLQEKDLEIESIEESLEVIERKEILDIEVLLSDDIIEIVLPKTLICLEN